MKRLILFLTLSLLWSCKKGGGDDVTPAFDQSLLPGIWKLQALTIDPSETGVWGKDVTDLLGAYRQQIGDDCIDSFRMTVTSGGKITKTSSDNCVSRTNTLFGFTNNGVWKASGSNLSIVSPYESGDYNNVTVDQTTMVWHRHIAVVDSEDNRTHTVTLTWARQ